MVARHREGIQRDYWHQLKAGRTVSRIFSIKGGPEVVDITLDATGYNGKIVGSGTYRAYLRGGNYLHPEDYVYDIEPHEVIRLFLT